MIEFIQVTAQYSNAVLVAILPHISEFAQKADLAIPTPVTPAQVQTFYCSPRREVVGGRVVLSNGFEFTFIRGHVKHFETPSCVSMLQDPERILNFFGPVNMSEEQAVALARGVISKMPGTGVKDLLAPAPKVTPPLRYGDQFVPRYRIEWQKGEWVGGMQAEIEINATTKRIEMLILSATNFNLPSLSIDVVPPPDPAWAAAKAARLPGPEPKHLSATYSNALLRVLLPKVEEFARSIRLPVPSPITPGAVARTTCISTDDPLVTFELTNGFEFTFQHGYVCAFNAPDCFFAPPEKLHGKGYNDFVAPVVMRTEEMVNLARQAVKDLGYSERDIPPLAHGARQTGGPTKGTKPDMARYFWQWDDATVDNPHPPPIIGFEVDASTGTLKSLFLLHTNLWRQPPQISVRP